MIELTQDDQTEIRALLIGRTVTKVDDEHLVLDDGTRLMIGGNEGCGGCENGNFDITTLNDCPVNMIMNVEFEHEYTAEGWGDIFRVFVYAADERIKLLEAEGEDNGYYGVGYWIRVTR